MTGSRLICRAPHAATTGCSCNQTADQPFGSAERCVCGVEPEGHEHGPGLKGWSVGIQRSAAVRARRVHAHAFSEARARRVATQIVRRAPAMLTLLESEFGDGFYILHSVVPRDAANPRDAYRAPWSTSTATARSLIGRVRTFRPNWWRTPGSRNCSSTGHPSSTGGLLLNSACQIRGRCRHQRLRHCRSGLSSHGSQLNSALGRSYACWQGVDAWRAVRARHFRTFPQPDVASLAVERTVDLGRWHPEYRFWFIVEGADGQAPPVTCVGSDGVVRTPDGATFDIEVIRREGDGNIWAPVAAVRTHLESTGLISPA